MITNKLTWAKAWTSTPKSLYIGGEWTKPQSQKYFESINPYNNTPLCTISDASKEDVDSAVTASKEAYSNGAWPKFTRKQRAKTLYRIAELIRTHREELATLESLDNGKTYNEAYNDDLPEVSEVFEYYAGWTDKYYGESVPVEEGFVNFTKREPLGVCALIVPWNFPLLLAAWKLAPALAMGNTVVIKPSPYTSLSLIRLTEILDKAQVLPRGVFNLVTGGNECGEALSHHPQVSKISFTGSTAVGKKIVEASSKSNLKSVTLELGGKSPNIIFDDVKNLDAAIDRSFTAMFCHKGEKCSEPTRFLIQESIYERVVERLVEKAKSVILGDPFNPQTTQGPQCHEEHYNKILNYIKIGEAEGARLLTGGKPPHSDETKDGFFVLPTIFGNVKQEMRIAREEIFGPVLCLIPFKVEEEAIRIANDTEYGLAAGLYTDDTSRAQRVANKLESGMVFVNHYGCYDFASPFGGVKQSGWGKEMGIHSLDAYTKLKSIWIKY